jgi:RNA-binding protein 26
MLFDRANAKQLRPWLIRSLEPMLVFPSYRRNASDTEFCTVRCDADPEVLADYVLALLNHDAPEADLRKVFVSQLEDFLGEGSCKPTFGS